VQWQAFALNDAAFCMRALGRLAEAAQPMQVAMKMRIALEDWAEAAVSASNLSELMLSKGKWSMQSPSGAKRRSGGPQRRHFPTD